MVARGRGFSGKGKGKGKGGSPGGRWIRGGRGKGSGRGSSYGHDDRTVRKSHHVVKESRRGVAIRGRGRGTFRGRGIRAGPGGQTPCFQFSKYGTCPRGTSCRYAHVRKTSTAVTKVEADFVFRHFELKAAHGGPITAISQSAEGIYTVSQDKTMVRWKPDRRQDGSGLFELKRDVAVNLPESATCLLYAEINNLGWFFAGLWDGSIQAFSKNNDNCLMKGHTKRVSTLIVQQNVLLSGSHDQEVRLWQADASGKVWNCTHTIKDSTVGAVHKLRVLPATPTCLFIGGSSGVAMCNLQSLSIVKIVPPLRYVADFLEFQGHLIAAYSDGSLRVFDAEGMLKKEIVPNSTAGPILSIGGLESGPRVLCTHQRGQVSTITLPEFEFKVHFQAFDAGRIECNHCADQGLFLLGHNSGTLQLWQRCPPG